MNDRDFEQSKSLALSLIRAVEEHHRASPMTPNILLTAIAQLVAVAALQSSGRADLSASDLAKHVHQAALICIEQGRDPMELN